MYNRISVSEFVPSPTNKVILDIPVHDYRSMDLPEENAFKYVCGYLIKKYTEIHSCDVCIKYVNENKTVLDDSLHYIVLFEPIIMKQVILVI